MKKAHHRRPLPVDSVEPEDMGRIVLLRAPPAGRSATSLRGQMALIQGYAGLLDSLSASGRRGSYGDHENV